MPIFARILAPPHIAHGLRAVEQEVETDYITASNAAQLLSIRLGRQVKPSYVHKIRNVRFIPINRTTKLYHRADIEAANIRQRETI